MSRIGKLPITVPAGVTVTVDDNNFVTVKGPKGTLSQQVNPIIKMQQEGNVLTLTRPSDAKPHKAMHGLYRALVANMVHGVTEGFSKTLEVNGVGYRAAKEGKKLVLNVGYSHQIEVEDTEEVSTEVPNPNTIVVNGIDKQKVGQFAADIRAKRPPEPYKGKGIKYSYEVVRHKEGKTGAK